MSDPTFDLVTSRLATPHSRRSVLRTVGKGTVAAAGAAAMAGPLASGLVGKPLTAAAQGSVSVAIVDFAFDPGSVAVDVGGTVTWTNQGPSPHTVTASDGSFDSGELAAGASFSHTFMSAGTFSYFCSIHPSMVGSVVVSGGTTTDSTTDTTTDTAPAEVMPAAGSGPPVGDTTPWLGVALAGCAAAWLAGRGLRKGAIASDK
jgi:plastocyanin